MEADSKCKKRSSLRHLTTSEEHSCAVSKKASPKNSSSPAVRLVSSSSYCTGSVVALCPTLSARPAQGMPHATHDEQHAFQEAMQKTQCTLVRLWAVADMWLMQTLQDAAMNSLLDLLGLIGPFALTISVAFERTAPESLLRTMLVGEVANSIIQFNHGPNGTYSAEQFESFSSILGFFQTFARLLTSAAGANHRAVYSATLNHALRAQFTVSN